MSGVTPMGDNGRMSTMDTAVAQEVLHIRRRFNEAQQRLGLRPTPLAGVPTFHDCLLGRERCDACDGRVNSL